VASAPYKAAGWGFNKTGIPGGLKQGWGNVRKTGKLFGANVGILKDNQANREAQIAGFMGGGPGGRSKALENKKGDEFRKKYKEESERYDSTTAAEIAKLIGEEGEIKDYASASKVSAMLHNLKSDSTKKEQFETNLRAQIIADNRGELNARDVNGNPRMSFEEKDVFIKQKMGQEWEKLNSKGREATNFALGKKQAPKTTA
jgi:hypothetical protein